MTSQEKIVVKMEKRLRIWGAKLDALATKAAGARVGTREDYQKELSVLRLKLERAQKTLGDFKASGDDEWDMFKTDMETVWNDISIAYKGLKV